MLTREEIKKYAHMRRLKLIDQIWKDYLQDLLLYMLYRKIPDMILGGGTSIWKVFKGSRFSEDIDAYMSPMPKNLSDYLQKEFSLLGIKCTILKSRKTGNMLFLKLGLSFPAHHREVMLSVEILSSSQPERTEQVTLHSPYPDIPPFDMIVLAREEMLINKVAAVYQRNRPRDIYDINLLLHMGTAIDRDLLEKKVPEFDIDSFKEKLQEKKKKWKSLEPLVVTSLPAFEKQVEYILSSFQKVISKPGKK
jgi:predicted nucleotidyltransferase component of viral defense system